MKKNTHIFLTAGFIVALALLPYMVHAQTISPKEKNSAARIATIKSRADTEIDKRVISLNELIGRINAVKHLSEADKSSYASQAQTQITNLQTLKTKIDADTELTILKTDAKSVFGA